MVQIRFRAFVVAAAVVVALTGFAKSTRAAFPIQQTAADETQPKVAYDTDNDRFLVVWNTGTGIFGRLYTGAGVAVGASFPIFWQRSLGGGDTLSYDQVAVTFKNSQSRFYVAARETYGDFINPSVTLETYSVAVKVLDASGTELYNRLPYGVTSPSSAAPGNPVIVADTYGADCCILLAWQDDVSRDVRGLLLDDDGLEKPVGFGGPFVIADGSSSTATYTKPAALYRHDWDQFVMTYERNPNSGSPRVGGRTIQAYSGMTSGELFSGAFGEDNQITTPVGGPAIAYHESWNLFMVAWTDGTDTFALGLDPDGPNPIPFNPTSSGKLQINRDFGFTGWPMFSLVTYTVTDAPAALAFDGSSGLFRAYVNEHSSSDMVNTLTTRYEIDLIGATSTPTVISGVGDGPKSNAAVAYSPVGGDDLVVWQRFTSEFTNANDIWGITTAL